MINIQKVEPSDKPLMQEVDRKSQKSLKSKSGSPPKKSRARPLTAAHSEQKVEIRGRVRFDGVITQLKQTDKDHFRDDGKQMLETN
jgi:hypothetical protein